MEFSPHFLPLLIRQKSKFPIFILFNLCFWTHISTDEWPFFSASSIIIKKTNAIRLYICYNISWEGVKMKFVSTFFLPHLHDNDQNTHDQDKPAKGFLQYCSFDIFAQIHACKNSNDG